VGSFPLGSIAILGGGACGWLAAAALARVLGPSCAVQVLETAEQPQGAIASDPSLHRLLRLLGIDEAALMRATRATFRLGTEFRDWSAPGTHYFQGFGAIGAALGAVPFQHHWLRIAAQGPCAAFDDFSVAAQAARQGRFSVPHPDKRSLLSRYAYAWHFDGAQLAAFLREHAMKLGATHRCGEISHAELNDDGSLRTVQLNDGGSLAAEFFIDAGGAGDILRDALQVPFDDWSRWLPCDRRIALQTRAVAPPPSSSECVALPNGWQSRTPLQGLVAHVRVFSSAYEDDGAALARLRESSGEAHAEPVVTRLLPGRPREFWVRNVLWLPGDALDPLEGAALHLAQTGITRLLAHFPARRLSPCDSTEYNRLTAAEYDHLRDLLALHYHATRRDDGIWRHSRDRKLPAELAQRVELFRDSGRITIGEEEFCGIDGWLSVLIGQGVAPRSYDPFADSLPLEAVRTALAQFAAQVRAEVARLPMHAEYLARRGLATTGA
jgi:tryptophan halogenase